MEDRFCIKQVGGTYAVLDRQKRCAYGMYSLGVARVIMDELIAFDGRSSKGRLLPDDGYNRVDCYPTIQERTMEYHGEDTEYVGMRYEVVRDGETYAVLDHRLKRAYGRFNFEETCYKFMGRHLQNDAPTDRCYLPDEYARLKADIMIENVWCGAYVNLRIRCTRGRPVPNERPDWSENHMYRAIVNAMCEVYHWKRE